VFGVWIRAFRVGEDVFAVCKRRFGVGEAVFVDWKLASGVEFDVSGVCNPLYIFGKMRCGVGVEGSGDGLWLGSENDTRLGACPVRLADMTGRIC
jgi:hypothetical protein